MKRSFVLIFFGVLATAIICLAFVKAPFNKGYQITNVRHLNLVTETEYLENVNEAVVTELSNRKTIIVKLAATDYFPERRYVLKRMPFKDRNFSGYFYKNEDDDSMYALYTEMFLMICYDDENYESHIIMIY